MFEDKVLKHKRAEGYYRRHAALGNVEGAWKNFVESNKVPDPSSMKLAEYIPRHEMDNFNTPDLEQAPDSYLKPGETLEDFDVTFRRPNAEGGRQAFYAGSSAVESHGAKIIKLAEAGESSVSIAKKLGLKQQTVNSAINAIENGLAGTEYKFSKPFKEILKLSVNETGVNLKDPKYLDEVIKFIDNNPTLNQKEGIKILGKKRAILVPANQWGNPGPKWNDEKAKLRNEADKAWTKKYSNISIEDKTRGDMNIHRQHAGGLREPVGTENTMFLESKKNTTEIRPFEKAIDEIQLKQYRNNLNRNLSTSKKKLVFEALAKEEAALRAANPEFSKYKSSLIFKESSLSKTGFMKKEVMSNPELTISEGKTGQKFKYKNVKPSSKDGKKIIELSKKSLEAKIKELGGKEKLTKILTNGSGTAAERTLLKQIITGGNTILKSTGKFVAGALNPIEFFKLKNLIGAPAAIAAVAVDTVSIFDDMVRKGQPFDVAAGNEFLTQFLDLNTESKQAQRILDDKGSDLSPAATEYAQGLVDFGKYENLQKQKRNLLGLTEGQARPEDLEEIDKQLKILEQKFSNFKEDGALDYNAAVNELGINEEQSEYIGEPKKAGMFYYAADDTNTIPKYPFLTEDMGTGQSRSDGFYRNADGDRIKVNEYGYATKGNIFDIPGKTGARVDRKFPYGETDQGRNPALLTEGEKIFRAETKQPAKYQKPFTYKDFNYQNKALSDEQYNNVLKYYQDQGFIKPGQKLEDVNIPKGYNKRIVNGKEYDPPKTFLQDTTEFFNIGDKWKQALYQPGMLGTQEKFSEGGITTLRSKYEYKK